MANKIEIHNHQIQQWETFKQDHPYQRVLRQIPNLEKLIAGNGFYQVSPLEQARNVLYFALYHRDPTKKQSSRFYATLLDSYLDLQKLEEEIDPLATKLVSYHMTTRAGGGTCQ